MSSKIEMVGGEINMDIKLDLEHLICLGLMAFTLWQSGILLGHLPTLT